MSFINNAHIVIHKILNLKGFIESKSSSFLETINIILSGLKGKANADSKVETLIKTISKFYEFVYHLMTKDQEKIILMRKECDNFNKFFYQINK